MRFCGLFASDHQHLRCAASTIWPALRPREAGWKGRLGLGSFSGDEVLLLRRPVGADLSLVPFIPSGAANQVLVAIEDGPSAQFRPEAVPPLRFRNLLGAWHVGPIQDPDFGRKLLAHVPDYLARDLRHDAAPDLLHLLFLACLHDMGRLEPRSLAPAALVDALRSTLGLLPKLLERAPGTPLPPVAACVTNGQHFVAAAQGTDLWSYEANGIASCDLCSEPDRTPTHDPRMADHPEVRVVALAHIEADEAPTGWRRVPADRVMAVTESGQLLSTAL